MSWFKSIFGSENKEKEASNLETPLRNNPEEDISIFEMLPVDEIEYRFQSMDQLQGAIEPNGVTQIEGEVHINRVTQPKGEVQPNKATQHPKGAVQPNGTTQPKKVFIPKILEEDIKLTIILVENTEAVAKEKDKLQKIVKNRIFDLK